MPRYPGIGQKDTNRQSWTRAREQIDKKTETFLSQSSWLLRGLQNRNNNNKNVNIVNILRLGRIFAFFLFLFESKLNGAVFKMPWYFPWSDSIKKRACRYLLQHYVGQFLQEKLTLDQLSVDLFNGKGIVKDVPLDVCVSKLKLLHGEWEILCISVYIFVLNCFILSILILTSLK